MQALFSFLIPDASNHLGPGAIFAEDLRLSHFLYIKYTLLPAITWHMPRLGTDGGKAYFQTDLTKEGMVYIQLK